jgi:replicative DNA helicase
VGLEKSAAMQLIIAQGWTFASPNGGQVAVEKCPFCLKDGGKFYVAVEGDPATSSRDGLWFCHKCQATGNLRTLQEKLGLRIAGVESRAAWAGTTGKQDALPNVDECAAALLGNAEVMDYLLNVRGFSREIIEKQRLGLKEKVYFRKAGETRALVLPYLSAEGNVTFAKYRSTPPDEKDFTCPHGHEAGLYNASALNDECREIIMVEGECDCISLLDHGIENSVGVPGAGVHKATWVEALDRINPKIYILFDNDTAGKKGAQSLASRIGIERCFKITLPTGVKDVNDYFTHGGTVEGFERLKEDATLFDVNGVHSSKDALTQLEDELNGKKDLSPTYVSQWPELNKLIGLEEGDILDLVAPGKVGKGGRVSTPVLTKNGWKPMGALQIGDELASIEGSPNFVTGVFPRGRMEMFRVTFSDGRFTDTTADHLWRVSCDTPWERSNNSRVYTTDAVLGEYCYPGSRRGSKLYIPLVSGDFGSNSELPIDPWLLGVLIGDGGLTCGQPRVTSADPGIVNKVVLEVQKMGDSLVATGGKYGYRINGGHLRDALKSMDIWGHKSNSKFIPEVYLNADKHSRWELLRGLMDTDGTASNRTGTPSYCTVSKKLAEDFVYLVRSLGGLAKVSAPQKKHFRYKGEMRTGQPAYIIVVRVPDTAKVFSLQRKLQKVKARKNQALLTFKSVESVGFDEAVCIAVSHPSKLYITDDFIVTHNSTMSLNLIDHLVSTYNEPGLIVSLEMTAARLAKKWISMLTNFEDNLTVPGSPEALAKLKELKECVVKAREIQQTREADLYFAYPSLVKEPEDIFKLLRDCIRRYGIKFIVFDNVQLLCDNTLGNRQGFRTIHLSQISKGFAKLAKDHKIVLIRILQPKKIEKGSVIGVADVDGSSQIEKDCDAMVTLWRQPMATTTKSAYAEEEGNYSESEESFSPKMRVTVGLSRYSSGGHCDLLFDGAKSQVRSYDASQKMPMQQAFNSLLPMEKPEAPAVKIATEDIAI